MSWLDRFFNRDAEVSIETTNIPFSTLARWSLYDLELDNPNTIGVEMGLNPVSNEGDEKEREDSADRIAAINHLAPFFDMVSDLTGTVLSISQINSIKESGLLSEEATDEDIEIIAMFFKAISISALIIAFSSAMRLGMIESNVTYNSVIEGEDYEQF